MSSSKTVVVLSKAVQIHVLPSHSLATLDAKNFIYFNSDETCFGSSQQKVRANDVDAHTVKVCCHGEFKI